MPKRKLKHIELFAGCGGMSLGLEKAGFELYFANELSPMAGETFAYNMLGENLSQLSHYGEVSDKVKWIKSNYSSNDLTSRLRENPFSATNGNFSDLKSINDIKGKLLVGDIDNLLLFFDEHPEIVEQIRRDNIDLLSGGPPCQGFSLAGKRIKDDYKNSLPLSFARVTGLIQPKAVILENVKGITSPFTVDGKKYYAWLEVSKAFILEGYVPICVMLNSKFFGVAQNRPRFIMFAYRRDVFDEIRRTLPNNEILERSNDFFNLVQENSEDVSLVSI